MSDDAQDLLAKIEKKGAEELAERVGEVDQLEPDEHERRKRAATFHVERHWNSRIGPLVNWLKFSMFVLSALAVAWLAGSFLWDIQTDMQAKKELLSAIIDVVLVAGATLYVEHRFMDK